jgi:uncharacterized Tic20 family protein
MERFDFFKETYFREEEKKNEINNSLSLPIGVITILIGVVFYLLTNFDFKFNLLLSIIFLVSSLSCILFLSLSCFHVIKSYTNFHNGYGYSYLADSDDLESFYQANKAYYKVNPQLNDISDDEFSDYILSELIKNTDTNQKNNKTKSFHRYLSLKHLITALLLVFLTIFPFSINYVAKEKSDPKVVLTTKSPIDIKMINR